ncbi:MAG: COG1615 family transporter, partial [Elusimicrobiaceae bacterium]|nr:COG1615 family transporter [Elusimicrobiaceae bacterium]
IYQKYHMQDAQVFYNQEDLWTIPKQIMDGKQIPMVPYYTIMKFPDSKKEEYILMLPYTPSQKDNMIAWMAARSDAPNVGELMVYQFPKEKLIYGPMQIEARIDQDPVISQQFKLWERQGSRIIRGSLMVIPVKDSLLYIEPIYLQAEISKIPELRRIIVAYGEKIAMEKSLDEALIRVITGSKSNLATNGFEFKDSEDKIASTSKEALNLFNKAQQQMRNGDYAGYGETIKQLSNVLNELAGANAGE